MVTNPLLASLHPTMQAALAPFFRADDPRLTIELPTRREELLDEYDAGLDAVDLADDWEPEL